MTRTRAHLHLLAALALGIAGDQLLGGEFWRLGLMLWIVLLVGAVVLLDERAVVRPPRDQEGWERAFLLAGLVAATLGMVLRDAEMLYVIDLLSLLCTGALLAWHAGGGKLSAFAPEDGPAAALRAVRSAVAGAPAILRDGLRDDAPDSSPRRRRREVLIGLLIAVPPLLLAAHFLGSADPLLGEVFARWTTFFSEDALKHVIVSFVIAWPVAGWLGGVVNARGSAAPTPRIGMGVFAFAGIAPTLYGLVILLATYLGLQARVLFGGVAYLAETAGLTVAEYARGGFFQLVAVAALVLGALFLADRFLSREDADAARRFRAAGLALLALVAVLILSAFARMGLYVRYFGLTDERVYALAGMVWIGVALGWFGWTVLRGRPERFGYGVLLATVLWVVSLNVINPEALVARVNVARAVAGEAFDAEYHGRLSADALPVLRRALEELPAAPCQALLDALRERVAKGRFTIADWREWNLPLSAAQGFEPSALRCTGADGSP